MQPEIATEIAVLSHKVECIDLTPNQSLVSLEGLVWVTASNSGQDIILGPGERISFPKRARAVVGGLMGRSVKVRLDRPPVN